MPSTPEESDTFLKDMSERQARSYATYDPAALAENLQFLHELVEMDLHFEPVDDMVHGMEATVLFWTALNLRNFVLEYRRRTGTFELPPEK